MFLGAKKEVKMKNKFLAYALLIFIGSIGLINFSFSQHSGGEEILRCEIPQGFIYKSFYPSSSGMKGIIFLQHQPDRLYSDLSIFEVFDADNNMLLSKVLDSGWGFRGFTPDNKLILSKGQADYLSEIKIIDMQGKELISIPEVGSRRLVFDLYGRDLAVAAFDYDAAYLPSVVYDLASSKEKFRLGPVPLPKSNKNKEGNFYWTGTRIFLPIGKDNLFLWGIGATILLQKYDGPGYIWKINDIGGNISEGKLLNEEYLAVSYFVPERKYKEGLAIIRWRDGQIVFRMENYIVNNKREKNLPVLSVDMLHLDENNNLFFLQDDGRVHIFHFKKENKTWDENLMTTHEYRLGKTIAAGKGRPQVIKGTIYYAEEEDGQVVIRRIKLN